MEEEIEGASQRIQEDCNRFARIVESLGLQVVRAVMENLPEFRKQHPAFAHLDPQKMIKEGLSAPLHPGALRYYTEQGWMSPPPVGAAGSPK